MLKRTIFTAIVLLLIALVVPINSVLAEGEAKVTVNCPPPVKLHSYPVVVVNVEGVEGLNVIQFDITYDPALLEYNSARNGQFGSTIMPVIASEEEEGTIRIIGVLGSDTVSGDGYVTIINFLAKNIGTSEIGISNGFINGTEAEIAATWTGGSITVGAVEPEEEVIETETVVEEDPVADEEITAEETTDTEDSVTIKQSSETQTITVTETDNAEQEKEATTGTSEETIKWPIVGGIIGGALVLLLLAIVPRFMRPGGGGYLD